MGNSSSAGRVSDPHFKILTVHLTQQGTAYTFVPDGNTIHYLHGHTRIPISADVFNYRGSSGADKQLLQTWASAVQEAISRGDDVGSIAKPAALVLCTTADTELKFELQVSQPVGSIVFLNARGPAGLDKLKQELEAKPVNKNQLPDYVAQVPIPAQAFKLANQRIEWKWKYMPPPNLLSEETSWGNLCTVRRCIHPLEVMPFDIN
ncbi:hypothetical protein HK097_005190 [Rhizophlyctis rosea]|uniref:Uncharacterized protein n=1 Tax=Rhizophlyctis rosea TaxID=64517 RepID=A0AAD5WYL2_9FUNG|nr:hypothetical protein HK097_005190 [Rhizophlyctis rosea]